MKNTVYFVYYFFTFPTFSEQNINLGESTNQLNSNHPAIEQPPRLSNFIGVPNSFPEFKRNEYDEGGVRKNFIYFNQVKLFTLS